MKQRGKQKVILYGNCHMECIRLYLLSSCQFSEKYEIVDLPPIFRLNQENINFDICIIRISNYTNIIKTN